MTPLQAAVFSALGQYPGVSDLVGARIYPDAAPQGAAAPYIVWQEISTIPISDLNGSAETGGLENARIQMTSYAKGTKGATDARELDRQVRRAMLSASGFASIVVDGRALPYEPDTKFYGFQSDFSIWLKT